MKESGGGGGERKRERERTVIEMKGTISERFWMYIYHKKCRQDVKKMVAAQCASECGSVQGTNNENHHKRDDKDCMCMCVRACVFSLSFFSSHIFAQSLSPSLSPLTIYGSASPMSVRDSNLHHIRGKVQKDNFQVDGKSMLRFCVCDLWCEYWRTARTYLCVCVWQPRVQHCSVFIHNVLMSYTCLPLASEKPNERINERT